MKSSWILLGVVGLLILVLLLAGGSYIGAKNTLVQKNEDVNQAYSQVDVVQQRRLDLIPNLVATVKGYVAEETRRRPRTLLSPAGAVSQSQGKRAVHAPLR